VNLVGLGTKDPSVGLVGLGIIDPSIPVGLVGLGTRDPSVGLVGLGTKDPSVPVDPGGLGIGDPSVPMDPGGLGTRGLPTSDPDIVKSVEELLENKVIFCPNKLGSIKKFFNSDIKDIKQSISKSLI
jgi:hypothetical protein